VSDSAASSAASADDADLRAHVETALAATYEVEREIGRGGMGIVYRARDRRLKRTVAIKVLPPELSFRRDIRSRFLREAETAAQLSHPNIVPIYSVDEAGNLVFFVMACVDGDNVARQLQRRGPLPVDQVRRWLMEIADALSYAHARGVVHRDIKPDNILVDAVDGRAVVTDFGIARAAMDGGDASRLTATGMAIGTPAYMSPEQASGDRDLDARSDLYSLGVVAYQMLTGEPPFTGNATPALLLKHLTEVPVPPRRKRPDVPEELEAIVLRLLEKQPEHRFQSAAELLAALRSGLVPTPRPGSVAATGSVTFNGAPIGGMRIDGAGTAAEPSLPTWTRAGGGLPPLRDWPQKPMDERLALLGEYQAIDAAARAAARAAADGWHPTAEDLARWEAPLVADFRRKLAFYLFMGTPLLVIGLFVDRDLSGIWTLWTVYMAWRYSKLWSEGYDWRDALRQPRHRMLGEVITDLADSVVAIFDPKKREEMRARGRQRPLNGALSPRPPAALPAAPPAGGAMTPAGARPPEEFGAWQEPVRQARADRDEIVRLLGTLPDADRARIPEVQATAGTLVARVEQLAADLARDAAAGGRSLADVDAEVARLEAEANPLDATGSEARVRRLAQLRRERRAVAEADAARAARAAQLDSCRIALENVRIDLVRLRTGGSTLQGVTLVAEQAMALARDVDLAVAAAQDVRAAAGRAAATTG
jgi:serine/threonine-protein kinase